MSFRLTTFLCLILFCNISFAEEKKTEKEINNKISDLECYKQFQNIFERVNKDYVQEPPKQEMTDAAINGMLNSLDPHSSYFTDEELEDFLNNTKGEFGGIGVEIMYDNGAIKVISPIDDLPAFKAGIAAGDYIVGVNDELVSTLGCNKAVKEMRGAPGTKVKLLVIKEDEAKPRDIEITREIVKIKPVKAHLEKENIAYLRISTFNEHTAAELKSAVKRLKAESKDNINGIILDLRNNPGGLLDQAVAVTEYFIDAGIVVTTKGRTPTSNTELAANKFATKAPKVPLIVLINAGSASASEIVAGALQDHKRALIIGTKSFGKGSVQTLVQISPRAAVKLTTAKYYTPNGRSIQAEGIIPDIVIEPAKVEYAEVKATEKRFSEASLRNYLKNDTVKEEIKKVEVKKLEQDKKEPPIKDDVAKSAIDSKETSKNDGKELERKIVKKEEEQFSELYKKDYQFARAYDLIRGLVLSNKITNSVSSKN